MTDKAHIIKILDELIAHPGWQYLKEEVMQKDILHAALDMAENKPLSEAEFNFRRGTMFAAKGFTELPQKARDQLDQELNFDSALAASKELEKLDPLS